MQHSDVTSVMEYTNHTNDEGLFLAFQAGNTVARNAVFTRYVKPLCFYVTRLTGSREAAEDIVADSFVKMLERSAQFNDLENIKAFLFHTTRNAAMNFNRDSRRHDAAHAQLSYLTRHDNISETWEDELIRTEIVAEICLEVENLPDKCREIFKLLFFQGLSTEQVAAQMGIVPQTVRNQKARAIQLLRVQLLKKGSFLAAWYLLSTLAGH